MGHRGGAFVFLGIVLASIVPSGDDAAFAFFVMSGIGLLAAVVRSIANHLTADRLDKLVEEKERRLRTLETRAAPHSNRSTCQV